MAVLEETGVLEVAVLEEMAVLEKGILVENSACLIVETPQLVMAMGPTMHRVA
jgi:hypothetical protein